MIKVIMLLKCQVSFVSASAFWYSKHVTSINLHKKMGDVGHRTLVLCCKELHWVWDLPWKCKISSAPGQQVWGGSGSGLSQLGSGWISPCGRSRSFSPWGLLSSSRKTYKKKHVTMAIWVFHHFLSKAQLWGWENPSNSTFWTAKEWKKSSAARTLFCCRKSVEKELKLEPETEERK